MTPAESLALQSDGIRSQALPRRRLGFTPAEWMRLSGFYAVIALLHVCGWGLFLYWVFRT